MPLLGEDMICTDRAGCTSNNAQQLLGVCRGTGTQPAACTEAEGLHQLMQVRLLNKCLPTSASASWEARRPIHNCLKSSILKFGKQNC